jgi:uncharacterized iron-regulated membrane protein
MSWLALEILLFGLGVVCMILSAAWEWREMGFREEKKRAIEAAREEGRIEGREEAILEAEIRSLQEQDDVSTEDDLD